MRRKIKVLLFLLLLGTGIVTSIQGKAAEAEEKTIVQIEVTDTALEVSYGSQFDVSDVNLLVHYSDGTVAEAKPDAISIVDTSKLGTQTITIQYKEMMVEYTLLIVPRQVTGVRMKKGTKTTMTVTWDALEEAEGYEIYTAAKENGNYTLKGSTEKNEYTFENMEPGKIIYVKIRAVSGDVAGDDSEVAPVAPKPDKVTGIQATGAVKTKITITWTEAAGATGYAIYYRLASDSTYTLAGTTEKLTYQITGLKAGQDYYIMVYAYAADISNLSDPSAVSFYGTAPKIPEISELKGGDKRVKVYWKKCTGAEQFRIYISTSASDGFTLAATVSSEEPRLYGIDGLLQKKKYYVKMVSVRTVSGMELTSESTVKNATTKKATATSTAAKYYSTKKKFQNSPAYKKYKAFRKQIVYNKSYIVPGLKVTNVAGFNTTRMVPQSITFAKKYLLISAYDYSKAQESVIYIMERKTREYITSLVLPHKGHVGGMAFDGTNLWIAYGKNLQCIKYSVVKNAALSGKAYTEIYHFTTVAAMPETVSYVAYYQDRVWAGAYNEKSKKYMYGYSIASKTGVPVLTQTNRMLMPNRTQGVAFTTEGKMIISRSCQTKKGRSGFICRLETYNPTWNLSNYSLKKNKRKKIVKMPPMNEGIAIYGAYTYIIYESPAFFECPAPVDRVAAFKTKKISG
ncbi:MAG: fibronectin type III domain-containing protein [Lachnospiraceae bacterium]|nr:fibronectin type III domain-containing protein [Lachnospiraceae bacterium]